MYCHALSHPEGVVFSRPGRYYPGGQWVELMYGTFTDYTGSVFHSCTVLTQYTFPPPPLSIHGGEGGGVITTIDVIYVKLQAKPL